MAMEKWNYWNRYLDVIKRIETTENTQEKEKAIQEFINGLFQDYSKDSNYLIQRLKEINSNVEVVDVPINLVDALKESFFCYVNGQFLSAVSATGITAELFCVHIYEIFLENIGIHRLQIKRRLTSFRKLGQKEKIDTLHAVVGINESICQMLHEIREKRNSAIHPNEGYNYKSDALDCLQNLIDILNLYTESIKSAVDNAEKEVTIGEKK